MQKVLKGGSCKSDFQVQTYDAQNAQEPTDVQLLFV